MCDLSIAIVTCGRPNLVRRCIRSIKANTKTLYKIVLLDVSKSFTDKPVMESLSKSKSIDKYIEYDKPLGIGAGYQMIAEACDTKYIFHIDDDIFLDKFPVIDEEYKYIKEHPDVGVVSCCWWDVLYNAHREAAMMWITGESEGKQSFKKMQVPLSFAKEYNFKVIDSDEALHSMIVNKEMVYDKGIHWDRELGSKGDRESFFLQVRQNNIPIKVLVDQIVVHDPKTYNYGSLTLSYDKKNVKEDFYKKYGYWPKTNWDKPQFRPNKNGKGSWV